jgi:putative transcriptional regulator
LHQPLHSDEQTADLQHGMETGCTVSVCQGVSLSTSTAKLRTIAASPPSRTRFLLGYAGWGPGQLAEEIARGSWLHADATPELIFDTPADDMWARALRSLGVYPESLVQSRGIH